MGICKQLELFIWFFVGFLENFIFLGFAFGFSFFEFILKSEGVFYEHSCNNGTWRFFVYFFRTFLLEFYFSDSLSSADLCPEALELYNTLFTTT